MLRDEQTVQECCQFLDWYSKRGAVILDFCAGTCPGLLAAMRLGRIGVGIEMDLANTGIMDKSIRRAKMFYLFLKHEDLLCEIGEMPKPATDWEKFGAAWQSIYAGFAGLKRPRWSRPQQASMQAKRWRLLRESRALSDVVLSDEDGLPVGFPRVNFTPQEKTELQRVDNEDGVIKPLEGTRKHIGRAVFATREFQVGEHIFPNYGKFLTEPSSSNRSVYCVGSKPKYGIAIYLEAEPGNHWGDVNDGVHGELRVGGRPQNNVKVVFGDEKFDDPRRCMYEVTHVVANEGQFLSDYGPDFWSGEGGEEVKTQTRTCFVPRCEDIDVPDMAECAAGCGRTAHYACLESTFDEPAMACTKCEPLVRPVAGRPKRKNKVAKKPESPVGGGGKEEQVSDADKEEEEEEQEQEDEEEQEGEEEQEQEQSAQDEEQEDAEDDEEEEGEDEQPHKRKRGSGARSGSPKRNKSGLVGGELGRTVDNRTTGSDSDKDPAYEPGHD